MGLKPPAKIITVFNEKGGSGKTTLACQLANTLGRRGYDVMLADLDRQRTSKAWAVHGAADNAFRATVWDGTEYGKSVTNEVKKFIDKYDFIIADCAPSVDQPATWAMLLVSHLGLIPTRLSPPDLEALKLAKKLGREVLESVRPETRFPIRVVANGVRKHMQEDREYLQELALDPNFPTLEETLGDRRAYQRSMLVGSSVHAAPGNKDAVEEVEALTNRVLHLLGLARARSSKKAVAK